MAATTIKVLHEWNQSGQNYGFLFKQIGERHSILRDEDFAVGFMNQVMESKLNNSQILFVWMGRTTQILEDGS
ncbi:hypothetical protein Zmor_012802 [Zophobas morio]|uniref:Uncharacterized protein n=1 Tax=Zophobas morio TaxID=2755281 RepID=A0AA38MF05_9CUCU|nr:hypothetical protein Zmor_012802 [Zophobas morio]